LNAEVEPDEDEQRRCSGDPAPPGAADELRHRKGQQRGEREVGDRHEALGHARESERWQRVPEGRVGRQVRPQREKDRKERCEPEHDCEPGSAPPEKDEAYDGQDRGQPSEVDELLAARPVPAVEEIGPLGLELADVGERAALVLSRPGDERVADGEPDGRGRD